MSAIMESRAVLLQIMLTAHQLSMTAVLLRIERASWCIDLAHLLVYLQRPYGVAGAVL